MAYPADLSNYTGNETLSAADHCQEHNALEAKVGIDGSAVTTSHDYKLGEVTGSDKAVGKTASQTLTNKTLTSPTITTPIINVSSDADGDMYYRASGAFSRLPKGTASQVLQMNGGATAPEWATIAQSPVTDGGAYIKPNTNGDTYRAYDSGGTKYADVSHDGTDANVTSSSGDLNLVPASNAYVTTAIGRQDNTTNTYPTNVVVQAGWGYIQGTGAAFYATKSVTFPTAFASAPIVVISAIGFKDTTPPSSITDLGAWSNISANLLVSGTSGFTAQVLDTTGTNISGTRYVGFSWAAYGVK